jgi:hypothetical protein
MVTLLLAAAAADRPAVAQQTPAGPASLTRPASLAVPRAARPLDPWERRSRLVSVNSAALPNRAESGVAPAAGAQVVIDLFDGASVTAVFDRFDPNSTGVTWVGHVPAQPGSLVTLVQGSGVLAASIILPDARYTIRPAPRDPGDPGPDAEPAHVLVQINSEGFMPEAPPIVPEITPQALQAAAEVTPADTAEFIDVLIVYTALAEAWAGGRGGIVNWINVGISETNSAYAASGVQQRVRLVHTDRVAYTEVGNFGTNLNSLRAGAQGLETVAALRNAYTADLVSLFVRPTSGATACGIAYLMSTVSTAFAPSGYSVVDSPCASPNGTLAHEFGHNMGLRHDWYMDAGVTPFTYAHGYVSIEGRFRTIMSYPDACTARGVSCARLLAFSNPDLTHLGQPMGVAGGTSTACPTGNALNMSCDADEQRALNDTALAVANFREFSTARPPLITTHPQNRSVAPGQPLTLQVAAEGLGPFTYQWYRGAAPGVSQPIAGATGPVYTFVPGADGVWLERWFYWARVSNTIGPANSNTATITIAQPAADAGHPQRRVFDNGIAAVRRRSAGGPAASPRTRVETPAVGTWPAVALWLLAASERHLACRAAEIEAELAWSALHQRSGDASAIVAALEQLARALVVLQDPSCRFAGGGR